MRVSKQFIICAATTLATATPVAANAATFVGLFNTGTDASNVALTGANGQIDPHYSILSSTVPGFAGNQAVTFSAIPYVPDDANSRWISVDANGYGALITTTFRLTFSVTGSDATTASIAGLFGSDNVGRIFLNGQDTGIMAPQQFLSLTPFTLNGLLLGVNTLDFEITNTGGPTALRLDELRGADGASAVPEPASWGMMIAGFAIVGGAFRRRRGSGAFAGAPVKTG